MSMLEVKNLSKSFGDLEVLKDISFNVEKGEVVAVIGPSGSGKSTLLRCINQLERADGGVINVCGTDMLIKNSRGRTVYTDTKTLRAIRLKTGLVFQNFNLFPHMTVQVLSLRAFGRSAAACLHRESSCPQSRYTVL